MVEKLYRIHLLVPKKFERNRFSTFLNINVFVKTVGPIVLPGNRGLNLEIKQDLPGS